MKRLVAVALCLFLFLVAAADAKETVDLVTFDAPTGWTKEVKANTFTSYTSTNKKKGTYCQIFVLLSTASKGSLQQDFDHEWKNLVAQQYGVTEAPKTTVPRSVDGWQVKDGTAPFKFNGVPATASLSTMTGNGKTLSIVAVTNSEDYAPAIRKVVDSVELKKLAVADAPSLLAAASLAGATKVALGRTNFDDGWTSTAQEDWVLVTKGATQVLIHYPNKKADTYNSVLLDGLKNAWSVLVAPRYGAMRNLEFKPLTNWEPIEFAEADAVEKATGKAVHVVLFKKNYQSGSGKYVELVTPDKSSFEKEFGAYHEGSSGWEKLEQMANYNKFIVSAADLQGTWTSDFSGAIQYVNAYTGLDAGTDTHASVETFQLGPGSAYKWDLGVASGAVGNIKFQSVKSSGKFSVSGDGWKVTFSDIEGKPRTFDASFSHVKGLRVLWLDNKPFAKAK